MQISRKVTEMKAIRTVCIFLTLLLALYPSDSQAQGKKKRKKIGAVVWKARTYIGTPYRYGGNSKSGIDCSGLIQKCYAVIDVKLPRTAKEQSKIGSSKSWGSLRRGDIVYFKFKQKGEKWWHTGMISKVEKGEIKFIHASTSRGVIESNLMSDYYKKNVKKFRRVI